MTVTVKDINFVAISTKYQRWLEAAQGELLEREKAGDRRHRHTNTEGRERKQSAKGRWERMEQVENLEIVYGELEFPGRYLEPELSYL